MSIFQQLKYIIKNENISKAFNKFIDYCIYKDLNEDTIKYYKENIGYFIKFYGVNKKCYLINEDKVQDYVIYMKNELKVKNTTINTRLKALRAFINFCNSKNYMKSIKIQMLKAPVAKQSYTDEEILKLIKQPEFTNENKIQKFSKIRNWIITNYLLSTR